MNTNKNSAYVQESQKIKMVFVGDAGVGKTSMLARYVYKNFQSSYFTTIGIDSFTESLKVDNKPTKLIMWDTAGMERYRSLVPQYIKDAQIAMIVYDITDYQTLCNAKKWIKDVKETGSDDICIVLIGNKLDARVESQSSSPNESQNAENSENSENLDNVDSTGENVNKAQHKPKIQVSKEMGEKLASDLDVLFFEVSAKTGQNVDSMFEQIVRNYGKTDENTDELPNNETSEINDVKNETNGAKDGNKVTLEDKNVTQREDSSSWCCFPLSLMF